MQQPFSATARQCEAGASQCNEMLCLAVSECCDACVPAGHQADPQNADVLLGLCSKGRVLQESIRSK
eukprot:660427-Amphidinium_carterae.1